MKGLLILLIVTGIACLPASVMAVSINDLRLNGFFDLEYEKADGPGHPVTPAGDEKGSFDQYHFNLLMEFPVNNQLSVKSHVEFEHNPKINKSASTGEINVEWAYLEYLLNNSERIKAGSFLTPIGVYNEIHDATSTYNSVRVPWEIYRAEKAGGFAMFPKYNTGINLAGNHSFDRDLQLNYNVYILNGENTINNDAERDDNSNKAIGGQLIISPVAGFNIGGSYYNGRQGTAPEKDHSSWIATLEYAGNHINVRAEYASSELDDTTEYGWYAEAAYRIKSVTPYICFGALDPDTDQSDDKWTEFVYGLNYEIQPNFIVKLENRHFGGDTNNIKVSEDYNEVGASVNVAF
ncbi:MAG: hypothetical protein IT393_07560 [Nitrospirae bacterium]|nr:hypothetical protein [Nitrospirota bacterium]